MLEVSAGLNFVAGWNERNESEASRDEGTLNFRESRTEVMVTTDWSEEGEEKWKCQGGVREWGCVS